MGIPTEILWEWDGNEDSLPMATLQISVWKIKATQNSSVSIPHILSLFILIIFT